MKTAIRVVAVFALVAGGYYLGLITGTYYGYQLAATDLDHVLKLTFKLADNCVPKRR